MDCPRCRQNELVSSAESGAPLLASWCPSCGGGFVPVAGLEQLLEELNHTRDDLRELGGLFGGERIVCPECRSRMSPLMLRGAQLDLCFGCGGLWCDAGELPRVTHGRHQLPAAREPRPSSDPIPSARALVRVDTRSLPQHLGRASLAAIGAASAFWWLAGVAPAMSAIVGVTTMGAALALSRREIVDIMPRARRIVRWRGFVPPNVRTAQSSPFPADACVVVRPLAVAGRPLPFVVIDLVDPEGRDLTRLDGPMVHRDAWVKGPALARDLGVSVRFDVSPEDDDEDDRREAARTGPRRWMHAATLVLQARPAAGSPTRRFPILDDNGEILGVVSGEEPPREHSLHLEDILAEHLFVQDAHGSLAARLVPAKHLGQRSTLVVAEGGRVYGHVAVTRSVWGDTFRFTGARGRRRAAVRLRHGASHANLVDGWGRVVGTLEAGDAAPGSARPVTLRVTPERLCGDARIGLAALAIHASLASEPRAL